MTELVPCSKCGYRAPVLYPYRCSVGGYHCINPKVGCPVCGRSAKLDWGIYLRTEGECKRGGVPVHGDGSWRPTREFAAALERAVANKWNEANSKRDHLDE